MNLIININHDLIFDQIDQNMHEFSYGLTFLLSSTILLAVLENARYYFRYKIKQFKSSSINVK